MRLILVLLLLMSTPLRAMEVAPLRFSEASEAVGAIVLSADAVPLGRLIAAQGSGDENFFCVVMLDESLSSTTSPLIVQGLLRAQDGSLRLPEEAAVLAERMQLSLPKS